jgi:hypothetical protein
MLLNQHSTLPTPRLFGALGIACNRKGRPTSKGKYPRRCPKASKDRTEDIFQRRRLWPWRFPCACSIWASISSAIVAAARAAR